MFCKKDFLKNFAKIHRKTSASKSFFYKAAGLFYRTTPLAASVDRNAKSNFKDFLHITLKKVFWENSQWAMVPETKTRRPLHIWSFQTRQKYEKYFIFKPQISSQLFKYWRHVDVHTYDYMPFHSIGIIYISHPISSKYLLSLSLKNTGLFQRYIYLEKPEITHNLVITAKLVLNLLSYLFLFRSSHRRYSVKKDVLKNSAKLTGKHLCWRLF